MYRRIGVVEGEFVSWDLPVRVHVPFPQQQDKLIFGEVRIDLRERNHVEREVPCGEPRVFPAIRHGEHIPIEKVQPVGGCGRPTARRAEGAAPGRRPTSPARSTDRTASSREVPSKRRMICAASGGQSAERIWP